MMSAYLAKASLSMFDWWSGISMPIGAFIYSAAWTLLSGSGLARYCMVMVSNWSMMDRLESLDAHASSAQASRLLCSSAGYQIPDILPALPCLASSRGGLRRVQLRARPDLPPERPMAHVETAAYFVIHQASAALPNGN